MSIVIFYDFNILMSFFDNRILRLHRCFPNLAKQTKHRTLRSGLRHRNWQSSQSQPRCPTVAHYPCLHKAWHWSISVQGGGLDGDASIAKTGPETGRRADFDGAGEGSLSSCSLG